MDWDRWPVRALDEIHGMFIQTLIDSIRFMEDHRARPTALHLGYGFSLFWRARHRRSSGLMVRDGDSIYGLPMIHDRLLDGRLADAHTYMSEVRIVSDGFGSERIMMTVLNDPTRLCYEVGFRSVAPGSGVSSRRVFSYAMIQNGQAAEAIAAPSTRMQEWTDRPRMHGLVAERQKERSQPRREMSELRIAWLT